MRDFRGGDVATAAEQDDGRRASRREFPAALGVGAMASVNHSCLPSSKTVPVNNADRSPLHYLSLRDVARRIERKAISPVELTQMMLDRIGALDARLHSYATVTADRALAAAQSAENEIQSGRYRGLLHGVPIAVKDLCYTRGVPTMGGLKVLRGFVPGFDATVVSKLEAAGAVLLGKLNLTEGAMAGYHCDFDIPVNPWGARLWSGVSSSGSGVATSAGLCFASLGTDTGGSIRFPAMANGIVGLKPTYGRVSRYGVLPLAQSLDHVGPLTRSVADAAIMLEAIAGPDPNDPTSLEAPVPDMLQELERGAAGVRIGFDRAYALDGVDPGLAAAIGTALQDLERLGAEVIEVQVPDVSGIMAAWFVICSAEAADAHRAHFPSQSDEYGAFFREFLESGISVSQADLANARQIRLDFSSRFRATLATVDAIVSPAAGVPYEIATGLQYGSRTDWNRFSEERRQSSGTKPEPSFTFPHDFAGTPALALPCGWSDDGLPYTMQLAGIDLGEAMLCRIGHAYETATHWHEKHPPV